jgi:hypothetical protein
MRKLLLALTLASFASASDPIIITPSGPPVFGPPVVRDAYLVTLRSILDGSVCFIVVDAFSIPDALATANTYYGGEKIAFAAWRLS